MFFSVSKGIIEFCDAMVESPHDWIQTPHEFVNVKHSDLRIWTCNGVWFVKIGGNEGLTLAEKRRIMKAVKLTAARKLTTPNVR